MNNIIGTEQLKPIIWMKPDVDPVVELGVNKEFWIAVEHKELGVITRLANYINKPIILDEHGYCDDWVHGDSSGEPEEAVGWHNEYSDPDCDIHYGCINFAGDYELLAWAEYTPPTLLELSINKQT